MITEYFRPTTIEEALALIARPDALPLGGGTLLSQSSVRPCAVVDLQALGLDRIHKAGEKLEIGATARLQLLLESPHLPAALKQALELEAPLNLRNQASLAGCLVSCDGRSPLATALLALDAQVIFAGEVQKASLGELLPIRSTLFPKRLITRIDLPLNTRLAFQTVARTPADRPIVCAALAQWPSGRTRLALGGWGSAPLLAMDGNEPGDVEAAARNAFHEAGDGWAPAEYRSEVAGVLAKRCLAWIGS
jgi:probable selenate reductase FAD-binding subunit